jgi:hypothetical protein
MSVNDWIACSDRLPELGVIVDTKLDDPNGCRNEGRLKRYRRTPECRDLWFFPDDSMYVYYTPTHWRPTA